MKTPNDISSRALRLLIRLSGLKQSYVAKRLDITDIYLNMILNNKRIATGTRKRIYNFLYVHNSQTEKIAA